MDEKTFEMQYISIGLEIKQLPNNYSPENFACDLMKDVSRKSPISYSDGTGYIIKEKYCEKNRRY